MSTKALKGQLLAAIAMTLVAAVALGSSTFAWFAANASVRAEGIQVTTQATGSLVIKNASEGLPTSSTMTSVVSKGDNSATVLKPSTHDNTWATYPGGLKYNTNPGAVSAETGLAADAVNNDLTFSAVPANGEYFADYVVYLASAVQELTHQDITVYLNKDAAAVNTLPGATSVDFYYAVVTTATPAGPTPGSTTYGGTLNLAKLDSVVNDAATSKTSFVISDVTIPQAVDSGDGNRALCVLMRIYVDGALKNDATSNPNTTFVKTASVAQIAGQTLAVTFENAAHT